MICTYAIVLGDACVPGHIGIKSLPKGSLPRLKRTIQSHEGLMGDYAGLSGPVRPYWSG